ncbi:excisionase [Ramlibacter alkalitolerans]|uniref:Excisionase n=1 Tax=Ramlibacter alkalitolerans TaxID=2039631 RepID=A0ABS1JVP4_9BURK|nr:excisionase [Ramlibacter alkalitolerans]MBL0427936.1 excisionase [Ramlibacter alkalitolerans]
MGAQSSDLRQVVAPARFVTLGLAAIVTGYTEKALRRKIEEGVWLQDSEYRRAPDGRILVDLHGYARWAEGERR